MSGDRIDIHGASYHNSGGSNSTTPIPILALLAGLLTSSSGIAGSATHATATALSSLPNTVNPLNALQLLQQSSASGNPVASINWILFDEHFNVIDKSFSPVAGMGILKDHYTDAQLQNITVDKNGYLYVYCSNESPVNVFFDNLQVVHTRGPLLEETHYYPFGLTMAGISSKAAGKTENKKLYAANELQSKEFSDGSGLDFYDFNARTYDQQTGRFLQVDPLTDEGGQESWNPYQYCYNNPINNVDADGRFAWFIPIIYAIVEAATAVTVADVVAVGTVATVAVYRKEIAEGITNGVSTLSAANSGTNIVIGSPLMMGTSPSVTVNSNSTSNNAAGASAGSAGKSVADLQKRADKLSEKPRPGEDFTKAGKEATKDLNKAKNGGDMQCGTCGTKVEPGKQSKTGTTPPTNEAHVDHVNPKSAGGSGTPNNGQVLCRGCNLSKGATPPVPPAAPPKTPFKYDW